MKIAVLSDLHEHLPDVKDVDMAIFCGDFCLRAREDYLGEAYMWLARFCPYFEELRRRNISLVGCPGNHDFILEIDPIREQIGKYFDLLEYKGLHELNGFKFLFFALNQMPEWAFYHSSDSLYINSLYYQGIYKDVDFLITHTGPHDILSAEDWGIKHISDLAKEIRPKHFHAFGHIHSRFGLVEKDGITYVNASYCKEDYTPRYQYPIYDTETKSWDLVDCEDYNDTRQ